MNKRKNFIGIGSNSLLTKKFQPHKVQYRIYSLASTKNFLAPGEVSVSSWENPARETMKLFTFFMGHFWLSEFPSGKILGYRTSLRYRTSGGPF
jgi:hypothetical protein